MLRRKLGAMLTTVTILALCAGAGGVLWLSQSRRASEALAAQQAQESLAELPAGLATQTSASIGTLRRLGDSPPTDEQADAATPLDAPAGPPIPDCVPLSGESKSLSAEDTRSAFLPTPPTGPLSENTS